MAKSLFVFLSTLLLAGVNWGQNSAKQPAFFYQFANEIQSGDGVRVAAAIQNANELQKEALLEVAKQSNTKFALSIRQKSARARVEPKADTILMNCSVLIAVEHFVNGASLAMPAEKLKGLTLDRYVNEIVQAVPKTSTLQKKP